MQKRKFVIFIWKCCRLLNCRALRDFLLVYFEMPLLIIDHFPYYVFVALCIVVIVVSLIKIAASNENIECFRQYFAVGYRAPDPSFFKSSCTGQDKK